MVRSKHQTVKSKGDTEDMKKSEPKPPKDGLNNIAFLHGFDYLDKVNSIAIEVLQVIQAHEVRLSDAYEILNSAKHKIDCSSFNVDKLWTL